MEKSKSHLSFVSAKDGAVAPVAMATPEMFDNTTISPEIREYRDMGCGRSRLSETKSKSNVALEEVPIIKRKKEDTDWKTSTIHALVSNLLELAPTNRLANSKILFDNFMNPGQEEIFNEEEATYLASLLMKKAQTELVIEEEERVVLQSKYHRALLTIRILSGHLNLPVVEEEDGPIRVTLPGSSVPITLPNIALDRLDPSSSPRDLSNHPNY